MGAVVGVGYRTLWQAGVLAQRRDAAWAQLGACHLCAHECGVDRQQGKAGVCRADDTVQVASYGPHFGEEEVLVGRHGSGTIFLAGCNLRCVFCQNWDVSHLQEGETVSHGELADMMLDLQRRGCHNVNFVTPTHYLPQILAALVVACEGGLNQPLVWNCGGYESLTALRLLSGVVDIYMPDVKFMDRATARRLTGARDYPAAVKAALAEMHAQVGDLVMDDRGLAYRGLLVRHLVLPAGLAGTAEFLRFVAQALSPNTYVNIMGQYSPAYEAEEHPPLDRAVLGDEVRQAHELARQLGLQRLA